MRDRADVSRPLGAWPRLRSRSWLFEVVPILGLTRFDGHVGYAARAECAKRSCSHCPGLT
jgi:hypothetical protein